MLNERFWSKVDRSKPDGCWLWTAGENGRGYGLFRPGGSAPRLLAHRLSYEDKHGPIPPGLHCLHRCDNPRCVNPDHLFLGTNADNIADRVRKGRSNKERPDVRGDQNWTRRHPDLVCRGESVGTSVYSEDQVRRVIELRLAGVPPAKIGSQTNVSAAAIDGILSRKSWRHISEPYAKQLAAVIKPPRRALTADDARAIRARLAAGETGRALAKEYGVHFCTISDIKTGKIWKSA